MNAYEKQKQHKAELEASRQSVAIEKYNYILKLYQDSKRDINPNVFRDLLATKLMRTGLFRTYNACFKWSTDYVACHYDPFKPLSEQEQAK